MYELRNDWAEWMGCYVFDPEREVDRDWGGRPHWGQAGTMTFITFRTADSAPVTLVRQWRAEMADWLRRMKIDIPAGAKLPQVETLPEKLRPAYLSLRAISWLSYLDKGLGACELRKRTVAKIVMDALRYFDEQRYLLDRAIIMPNHVHLLAQLAPGVVLRKQCTSWMKYSALKINEHLHRSGRFWRSEPFDHLIRSEQQLERVRKYIETNGVRAGLPPSDYLYWQR